MCIFYELNKHHRLMHIPREALLKMFGKIFVNLVSVTRMSPAILVVKRNDSEVGNDMLLVSDNI